MASLPPGITKRNTDRGVRYDVRYRTLNGEPRRKTFTTRADAEQYQASVKVDKRRGLFVDPRLSSEPFGMFAAEWLASNPGKRSTSLARDETIVRLHLLPNLAKTRLHAITPKMVQQLVNEWSKQYAPRTVKRHYEVLRAIMSAAVATDQLARTPCRNVKLPEAKREQRHVVTADELVALADAMDARYYPLVFVGALLGLRWGECAGLRVGRCDILGRTVTVAEQITRGEKGRVQVGAPKSDAGVRTLALPVVLADMLAEHLQRAGLTAADADAFVFTMPGGGPLRYERFRRKVWIPACIAAGLGALVEDDTTGKQSYEGLTFHDLRRTSVSHMVHAGVDVHTAMARAGHADVRLTLEAYAQASTEADRNAAEAIAARLIVARPRVI